MLIPQELTVLASALLFLELFRTFKLNSSNVTTIAKGVVCFLTENFSGTNPIVFVILANELFAIAEASSGFGASRGVQSMLSMTQDASWAK